jgi:hypothetical protein
MMIKVVCGAWRSAEAHYQPVAGRLSPSLILRFLPVRSMVGQLPLEQHIGVRIPDGQPLHPEGLNSRFYIVGGSLSVTDFA